ncbi:MAG: TonB-dependent receptor, partial [Gemmatimonadetes bacterium]|nr:TonB-dependent receptor [Gemmatimonadota bacterium]
MARTITLVALGIALGGLAAPLGAQQSATTGAFRGRVADEEGRPIAGAQVVARNEATGLERSALADEDGRFLLPLIPPGGPYTLRATSVGYRGIAQSGYNVGVGDVVSVTLELPVQAVEVAALEVTAAPARIDVTQGGVVQRVGPDEVENLPVNGRDFTDFLNLSPLVSPHPETGTGGQFAVGGARASATNVQIDGADANNLFFGENRGSSRTPFAFSLESIKEFQLITNGFDVEHGNYLGGVMNAVTKGGTNEFRGSLFYLQRDEALTANDFLNQDPRDFTSKQFGLNVSGPAVRDKLHYFLSVDVQRKTQPIFAATPASTGAKPDSINKFLQILEQKYGVPSPGRFYGEKEQEENNLVLFGRVDWNLGRSHRLTVRQNYSSFEQTNDRIGATEAITNGGPFRDTVFSTVAELNSVLGGRAFNTLRFQWSDEVRPRPANPDGGYVPQVSVAIDGFRRIVFGGDGIIFRNRLKEKKLQFVDNFTIRSGAHTFKLGTNNLISTTENEFWLLGTGSYTFNSLKDFAEGRPANYFRLTRKCAVPLEANALGEKVYCPQYDVPFAEFQALEWSAYAQDDWQVNERLQLTAGVRYGGTSFQDQPGKVAALETAFGVRADVVPDFSGISPRLSFTYDLSGDQARL